jgi:hypothetical protein
MFRCGLFRSNFAFAIGRSPSFVQGVTGWVVRLSSGLVAEAGLEPATPRL